MPLMKKLDRSESREILLNLTDLGFTVQAIAFMLNKTEANIYALLTRAGRKKGRDILRYKPSMPNAETRKYIGRVFSDVEFFIHPVLGVAMSLYQPDVMGANYGQEEAA